MKILVTGGAGYIGSITNTLLQEKGYETIVFDNMSCGHKEAVGDTKLIVGDLTDETAIDKAFSEQPIDAVIHFAAKALAGESMEKPHEYYTNNIVGGLNLLDAMQTHGCTTLVFSSTCALYGTPLSVPVSENAPIHPESVYASSKRMFEEILDWYETLYGIHSVKLRYFNACGAMLDGTLGENHTPETHIIPIALEACSGKRGEFEIFGDDYDTPDGTCIRDYIHVMDLADAHIKALEYIVSHKRSDVFNLGVGRGYSNREVINAVEKITGKKLNVTVGPRRPGDPAQIYADNTKAKQTLGWEPKYSELETIVGSAWKWHQRIRY